MKVAVCTRNQDVRNSITERADRKVDFYESIPEVEVKQYDCSIIDLECYSGVMDIIGSRGEKTVYIVHEAEQHNMDKIISSFAVMGNVFTYSFSGEEHTIDLNDVMYFESEHRTVKAFFENGEYIKFYSKLDEVELLVDNFVYFVRVNKSFLVNYNYCTVKKDYVEVYSEHILISRMYKKAFFKKLEHIKIYHQQAVKSD